MYEKPLCRHCGRPRVNRPRGLCWSCYYAPGIRENYPVLPSPGNRRGVGNDMNFHAPLPAPTGARPGTAAKCEILGQRAINGENLWHPDDAKCLPLS